MARFENLDLETGSLDGAMQDMLIEIEQWAPPAVVDALGGSGFSGCDTSDLFPLRSYGRPLDLLNGEPMSSSVAAVIYRTTGAPLILSLSLERRPRFLSLRTGPGITFLVLGLEFLDSAIDDSPGSEVSLVSADWAGLLGWQIGRGAEAQFWPLFPARLAREPGVYPLKDLTTVWDERV